MVTCAGDCVRVVTYYPDSNYWKRWPVEEGETLRIIRLAGEPTYFTRPGSCVVMAQARDQEESLDGDACWEHASEVKVVSVRAEFSELTVMP